MMNDVIIIFVLIVLLIGLLIMLYKTINRRRKEFRLQEVLDIPYEQISLSKRFVQLFDGKVHLPEPQILEVFYNDGDAVVDPNELNIVVSLDFDTIYEANPIANHHDKSYAELCSIYSLNLHENIDKMFVLLKEIYDVDNIDTLYEDIKIIKIAFMSHKYIAHAHLIPSYKYRGTIVLGLDGVKDYASNTITIYKTKNTETRLKEMYFR